MSPHELLQNLFYAFACDAVCRIGGVHGMLHVVAGRCGAELDGGCVLLAVHLKLLNALRELAGAEHEHARSERVEGSGMAYLYLLHPEAYADALSHYCQGTEAGHAKGFVYGDDFAFGEIHSQYVVY